MLKKLAALPGAKVLTTAEQRQVGQIKFGFLSLFGPCPPQTCSVRDICVYC